MITQKGSLVIGIEYDGKIHKEFELRPQIVRDTVNAFEHPKFSNDMYAGLILLSMQILKLGDIPKEKITPELLLELYEEDLKILFSAKEELANRLKSFRSQENN